MSDTSRTALGAGQIRYVHFLHLNSIILSRDTKRVHDASQKYLHTLYTRGGKAPPDVSHRSQW